jgi:HK97 family phage major capsid protein
MNPSIQELREELDRVTNSEKNIYADAASESRQLTTAEKSRAERLRDRGDEIRESLDAMIRWDERERKADAIRIRTEQPARRVESRYYNEGGWVSDVISARRGDTAAIVRLSVHDDERRDRLNSESRSLYDTSAAGAFVPVQYLADAYGSFPNIDRPYWDAVGPQSMGAEGMRFEVPVFGAAFDVGSQTAQGSAVPSSTPSIGTAIANTRTVASSTIVSLQSIDRGRNFETALIREMQHAYHAEVETQSLSGAAGGSTLDGILAGGTATFPGLHTVTVGTAEATGAAFLDKVAEGIAEVTSSVFSAASDAFVVMHPRRWMATVNSTDDDQRPYVSPIAPSRGRASEVVTGYGAVVGYLYGLPVILSGGVSTAFGDGENEDRIGIVTRSSLLHWEASREPQRLAADVDASGLTARLTLYGYVASAVIRPTGIAVLQGPGLVNPFA